MKKILVIQGDQDVIGLLRYGLENEEFRFVGDHTGKGAIELCIRERPDLVLLEIILPEGDGLIICQELRNHPQLRETPVIFLTACGTEYDRVRGFEVGANDYIVKPFSLREVITRIKVQLRSIGETMLRAGGLELDRTRRQVQLDGQALSLTATEFRLLEHLMEHPAVIFGREELLDAVWRHESGTVDRAVDTTICRLRRKLENDLAQGKFIVSVRGLGYCFVPVSRTG